MLKQIFLLAIKYGVFLYEIYMLQVKFGFGLILIPGEGGGGTPGNSWWGCAALFSKSRLDFRVKSVIFARPFSDQTSKMHTRFQTWLLGGNYVIIT